ncbi:MAG: hypothetical protein ACXVDU_08775 [Bacteroidia bacterium]
MKGLYFESLSSKKHEKTTPTIKSFYEKESNAPEKPKKETEVVTASAKPVVNKGEITFKKPAPANPVVLFESCDTLFLRDGTVIAAKIVEVNSDNLKYRYCGGGETEVIRVILKSNIEQVVYANGKKETFAIEGPIVHMQAPHDKTYIKKKHNGFSIGGFILSLLAVPAFLVAFILAILGSDPTVWFIPGAIIIPALALCIVGMIQAIKHRDKFKFPVFAIIGLAICSFVLLYVLFFGIGFFL